MSAKKISVMIPRGGMTFRRTVRKEGKPVLDDAGNPRVLVFNPGEPLELSGDEIESVRDDIGNVLHIAKPVEGKPAVKVDGKATAEFVAATKEAREKAAAKEFAKEATPVVPPPAKAKDIEHKGK